MNQFESPYGQHNNKNQMRIELAKPISEMNAGEAYLRFMATQGPDDPAYTASFDRLMELVYGQATGYAWKVIGGKLGNPHYADLVSNAVQQAFLKIIRQQRQDISQRTGRVLGGIWNPEGNQKGTVSSFSTWFHRVVRTSVMDLLRSEERLPQTSSTFIDSSQDGTTSNPVDEKVDEHLDTPLVFAINAEKAHTLKRCLDQLEDPLRKVLLMMYYEHHSQSEIADKLGTNHTAVSRWKNTAFQRMQNCVGDSSLSS